MEFGPRSLTEVFDRIDFTLGSTGGDREVLPVDFLDLFWGKKGAS